VLLAAGLYQFSSLSPHYSPGWFWTPPASV
jgi:hypothetical protein